MRAKGCKVKWEGVRINGKNGGSALPAFFRAQKVIKFSPIMQSMAGPQRREGSRVETTLREISEKIETRTKQFELLEAADELVRQRASILYDLYVKAGANERMELLHIESAQEYFSGQVRAYLEAKGFETWDAYLKPTLSDSENLKLRGEIAEDWMKLPAGRRNDPIAMYLLLMKHEVFGLTGPRLDENGLDWVQDVLAPTEE